jgi:hypothetical protein
LNPCLRVRVVVGNPWHGMGSGHPEVVHQCGDRSARRALAGPANFVKSRDYPSVAELRHSVTCDDQNPAPAATPHRQDTSFSRTATRGLVRRIGEQVRSFSGMVNTLRRRGYPREDQNETSPDHPEQIEPSETRPAAGGRATTAAPNQARRERLHVGHPMQCREAA